MVMRYTCSSFCVLTVSLYVDIICVCTDTAATSAVTVAMALKASRAFLCNILSSDLQQHGQHDSLGGSS